MIKEIVINWSEIDNEDKFYDVFLSQVKAPKWHGRNLDALNDSQVTRGINKIEKNFTIMNENSNKACDGIVDFQRKVLAIFLDAVIEYGDTEVVIK